MNSFQARAQKLGHDLKAVDAGQEVWATVQVHSIDELRQLLHEGAPPETRANRAAAIRATSPAVDAPHDASGETILRRVEGYVFGDAPLAPQDRTRIQKLFPMSVKTLSVANKTLGPGEVWDLGTSTSPVTVNLGTLTMESGSSIVIRNTVLSFTVETLVRNAGGTPGQNYDLGIFGVTGPTGSGGATGGSPGSGNPGTAGTCSSPGIAGDPGGPGGTGPAGAKGEAGGPGKNGLPSLTANIRIGSGGITGSSGQFVIMTRSGTGGYGGVGGRGGTGGAGGPGGGGATCGCEGTNGGHGGRGGTGGVGGTGGDGGNGSNGSDIYVVVPPGQSKKIIKVMQPSTPGQGGTGGRGGSGGGGGGGGGGGKHHSGGGQGGGGPGGQQGMGGKSGTQSGVPGTIYVNESGS